MRWSTFCLSIYFHSVALYNPSIRLGMQAHYHLFLRWIYPHISRIFYLRKPNNWNNHNLFRSLHNRLFIKCINLWFIHYLFYKIILFYSLHLNYTQNLINDQHRKFCLQDQLGFICRHLLCIHNYLCKYFQELFIQFFKKGQ